MFLISPRVIFIMDKCSKMDGNRMMTHSVAKESKMTIIYELNYGDAKSVCLWFILKITNKYLQ